MSPRNIVQSCALALALAAASLIVERGLAQGIVIPNTFTQGTAANAPEVNANFTALANNALNRTGGTMTGTLTVRHVLPTTDTTYDVGDASHRVRHVYADTVEATTFTGLPATASVPAGSVIFYDGSSCPAGYAELTSARGRYLVGLPSGGTLDGQIGTALSDTENRATGVHGHTATVTMNAHNHTATDAGHTHSISDPTHSHGVTDPGHVHNYRADDSSGGGSIFIVDGLGVTGNPLGGGGAIQSATTGVTVNAASTGITGTASGAASISVGNTTATGTVAVVNSTGTAGTNAPYLQLLVCKKS